MQNLSLSLNELLGQVDAVVEVEAKAADTRSIAIVGMALKFPGADDVREYWRNLKSGHDSVTALPGNRKQDIQAYVQRCLRNDFLDADYEEIGYLDEIDTFDYEFFGLSPKEASLMDPAHKLFLQCAWQAVEDAGLGDGRLAGTDTGVFLGYSASDLYDYKRLIGELEPESANLAAAGNIISMMASRVAYLMDLKGPSMMIDTACSSSLVALHEAVKSIRCGDCSAAIVGGIRLNLVPVRRKEKLGIESSDGHTRTFDEYSDGSTLSEGVGAVFIKPLGEALKDGDHVYAVIKGVAVNQDGRSNGITAPNPDAHAAVIEKAWKDAGVHPETITYIEAHGTGTRLGDPVEMEGLMKAFGRYTDKKQFCAIGSVKSNLGHLDSAAGMAGLIKAALALSNRELPPTIHFRRPNRKVRFHTSPFYVNARMRRWEHDGGPRRCGVSSFGISGTNAHAVLEEAPDDSVVHREAGGDAAGRPAAPENPQLFAVSAKSAHSLIKLLERHSEWLDGVTEAGFEAYCRSSLADRAHYKFRLTVRAGRPQELSDKLLLAKDTLLGKPHSISGEDGSIPGNGEWHSVQAALNARDIYAGYSLISELFPADEAAAGRIETRGGAEEACSVRRAAVRYTAGGELAVESGSELTGRRRARLPVYPFQRKRCWLGLAERELYRPFLATGAELYMTQWQLADAAPEPELDAPQAAHNSRASGLSPQRMLLFADRGGVARRYAQLLEMQGASAVLVIEGEHFARIGEYEFEVGPSQGDYAMLIEAIRPFGITGAVHFAALDTLTKPPGKPSFGGLFALFRFVEALRAQLWKSPIHVTIIAPDAYRVTEDQAAIRPEHAAMFGYGKVIPYELPGSKCRCVDWNGTSPESLLFEELGAKTTEYMIAFRRDGRYSERILTADADADALASGRGKGMPSSSDLREGGTYIITGGIGIVGLQIARMLASMANVKIVLLNRSSFPTRSEWKQIRYNYEMNRKNERLSKRIALLEQIEAAGSEVICLQADITDETSLGEALASIRRQFGPIRGIVHAAGIVRGFDAALREPTFGEFREDLLPKTDGTLLIDRLTEDDPLDFFLLCSSVMTLTGGANVGGYVAANAFLDAFAEARSARGRRTVSVNWSTWEETFYDSVASLDDPQLIRNYGQYTLFKTMTGEHAALYLTEALASSRARLIAGQANRDGDIFRLLDTLAFRFDADTLKKLTAGRIHNRLESDSRTEAAATAVDVAPDFKLSGSTGESCFEEEWMIGGIWSSVLGYKELDVKDNFYDLGGDSIAMMKVISGIGERFGYEMKPTEFMERLTIGSQAGWLNERQRTAEPDASASLYPQAVPDPDNLGEPFNLTEVQRAYFIGRNNYFELGGVSTHAYSEVETRLDMGRLAAALNAAIRRHPMLRCIVTPDGKQRILGIEQTPEYRIDAEDIRSLGSGGRQERIERERSRMSHDVFRTDRWPLFEIKAFRTGDDTHYLCIGFDVLIADGLSMQIIERDVMRAYLQPEAGLPPLDCTFRDYMQAYEAFRRSDAYHMSKRYWLEKLESFPEPPSVPLQCDPGSIVKPTFVRLSRQLASAQSDSIKRLAAKNRVTPSAVYCTIYADVLARWSGQRQLAVNLTVFNRYPIHHDIPEMVGDFTSLMLLGLDLGSDRSSFWDRARIVNRTITEALEHRHFDGVEMIRELARLRRKQHAAVMPYVFTSLLSQDFQGAAQMDQQPGDVKLRVSQTSQAYLDFQLTERGGETEISWDYVSELFDEEMIEGMFDAYLYTLGHLAERREHEEVLLPERDIRLYEAFNATEHAFDGELRLDRMFARQAKMNPERIAVIAGERQIDYGGLLELSRRYAAFLLERGVARGDLVGVIGKKTVETAALVLGILTVGAAYVPIDPDYPEERRNYIVRHSGCAAPLDAHAMLENPEFPPPGNITDIPGEPDNTPDDLAYVIYTSGSTGAPKGVAVTHRAAANTVADVNAKFGVGERDRIAAISSLCFDLSVYDWFGAWAAGAATVIVDDPRDMPGALRTALQHGVTVWNSVPALMGALLDLISLHGAALPPLRVILLSGDWIPLPLARNVLERFPSASFVSLGGATEAAIWSIYCPVDAIHEEWRSVPYGVPLANQRWYVLGETGELCPVGVPGELYIGGSGLASCYWRDEEKTSRSFVSHPMFGSLYRTGDFGMMHRDGLIEFLGRRDTQVKVRGYRVELGEVESWITRHAGIKEAAVVCRKDEAGQPYLAAYAVSDKVGDEPTTESVAAFLGTVLPSYMIPSRYMFMERLPLSPNGKVDRKALPEPQEMPIARAAAEADIEAKSDMERLVLGFWKQALGVETVGTRSHFFDIGGDSIRLMNVHAQLESIFPGKTGIADLFAYPTVESFAAFMERRQRPAEYERIGMSPGDELSKALSTLAGRNHAKDRDVYLLAFVYFVANALEVSEVRLAAFDRTFVRQTFVLQLENIESVADFIAELQNVSLTDKAFVAAEVPFHGVGSRMIAFTFDEAAVEVSLDNGTGAGAAAAVHIEDNGQVQVSYKREEGDAAARHVITSIMHLLEVLAKQQ